MWPAAAPILPNALCTAHTCDFCSWNIPPPLLDYYPIDGPCLSWETNLWNTCGQESKKRRNLICHVQIWQAHISNVLCLQRIEVTSYMGKLVTQSLIGWVTRNSFIIDEILISCNWLFWTRVVGSLGLPIKSWTIAENYRRTFPLVGKGGGWLQKAYNWHTLFIFSYIKVLDLPVPSH